MNKDRRLSPEEKAHRRLERLQRTIQNNPKTSYDIERERRKTRKYEDIGGRY